MRRVSTIHLTCALAALLASTPPPAATAQTARAVYVTVIDRGGQPVTGLTTAEFGVKEGGKDCDIVSVEPATERMRLALMVEAPLAAMGGVRVGIAEFIERVLPHAEISLILVTQRNETVVDYTSDPNALVAGISNLPLSQIQQVSMVPEGLTDLARQFEKAGAARPVIVLVALERNQESAVNPRAALDQLARSRAQLSVVSIEGGITATTGVGQLGDVSGRSQVIGDGSRQSGGRRVEVTALTAFSKGLQQVADDLSSQYLITYTLPDGVKPSDRLNVTLKRKGVTLRAPTRISSR